MKRAHAAIGVCRAAFLPPPEARPIATDDQIERVARAICEATSGPFEMLDDVGRDALRWEARAAIAAMAPALSPEMIEKLNKLATYLTEQGEYEACDLIDTVVERLTPKAKG
jgi:lipoprotein NlpI